MEEIMDHLEFFVRKFLVLWDELGRSNHFFTCNDLDIILHYEEEIKKIDRPDNIIDIRKGITNGL